MAVTIVADQGTHLLVSQGNRFAIVERRNNRLYSCHAGKRDGIDLDDVTGNDASGGDISAIGMILDDRDWIDEASARAAFSEIVARGTHLSQHML